jgi:hypothetical protein
MPPRFAYWTILIDQRPTAFRATDKADLLPTFHQLRRTNADVVFKWFARGRMWESPDDAARSARRPGPAATRRHTRPGTRARRQR